MTQLQDQFDQSSSARIEATLSAIDKCDAEVLAFVHVAAEQARSVAQNLDTLAPSARGPLHGVPVAIKEIIDVEGMICGWGSGAHTGRRAERDADVVAMLKSAGANVVGTTTSTEYAIAAAPPTRNPHRLTHTPGGSSSGSAAAVAAGMVPLSVGTQTIGSIIRPALYCGVAGFKTSVGSVPMAGIMPLQKVLDQVGFLAADWAMIVRALSVFGNDIATPARNKCYWIVPDADIHLDDAVIEARDIAKSIIRSQGFEIVAAPELSARRSRLESLAHALTVAGLAENHAGDFDRAPETWSARAQALLDQGRVVLAEGVASLLEECDAQRSWVADVAGPGDIFLSDAICGPAPSWAPENTGANRLQAMWSVLGLPTAAWTVTMGHHDCLPVGVQISAPAGADIWLAQLMDKFQGALNARDTSS